MNQYLENTQQKQLKLCTSYGKVNVQINTNKKLVVKVIFSGPGPYAEFYSMGSDSTIAC